jgi:RNA polymerase sigma-54 factor
MDGQMKLSMTGSMRMEQRMKLAPRMIQSMEILQLPLLALQERIDQELSSNPVLETAEEETTEQDGNAGSDDGNEKIVEEPLKIDETASADEFQKADRFEDMDSGYEDYASRAESFRKTRSDGEPDKKLEALQNTAATEQSLHEYLTDQWRMADASEEVKMAGFLIIDFTDEKGYLTVRLEQLYSKDRPGITLEHLNEALEGVQKLEPAGVGARDLRECLLLQMNQSEEDYSFEKELAGSYMSELLENRLPEIAKKMNCNVERINRAISHIRKLDTSPGLQVGRTDNHPVLSDIIIEPKEGGGWDVQLADTKLPALRVNNYYAKMSRNKTLDDQTRQFLIRNIRSAQWLMDALEQRKGTLLKVARIIAREQTEFLEKGQLYLKALPMSKVAQEVGVHIATVSRAVAGKYVQCPQGVMALRSFFSGGMETQEGENRSWEAVRGKLQEIVTNEDKRNPLNDDQICNMLHEAGFKDLARRTVAKYRKLMNIPAVRFRRKY